MATLTIGSPSHEQLTAMGDALLQRGEWELAAQIYRVALRDAPPAARSALRIRGGIASAPSRRTRLHLQMAQAMEATPVSDVFVGDGLATWLKTLPFFEDARFVALAEKHANLLPIANWHWNLQTALWAVQQAMAIPGDFVELGVFKGHTTLFCAEYVEFQAAPKTWWLYDTFEGIPDDQIDAGWETANRDAYKGTFSYAEVAERFAAFPNIRVTQGRVPEVLAQGAPEAIAFMHIDMNNSAAEIGALEALFDRVSRGGVILFDDYAWNSARAQFDAERAWFARRGLHILPLPTGQGLFVKS